MSFPVSYFEYDGTPVAGAAGTAEISGLMRSGEAAIGWPEMRAAISILHQEGFSVTRVCPEFAGQVARVKIEVFGNTAENVAATLREYAGRCDAASQASECSYGQTVIERNLLEEDGNPYSWKGRITLHPSVGSMPSSKAAVDTLDS